MSIIIVMFAIEEFDFSALHYTMRYLNAYSKNIILLIQNSLNIFIVLPKQECIPCQNHVNAN